MNGDVNSPFYGFFFFFSFEHGLHTYSGVGWLFYQLEWCEAAVQLEIKTTFVELYLLQEQFCDTCII